MFEKSKENDSSKHSLELKVMKIMLQIVMC